MADDDDVNHQSYHPPEWLDDERMNFMMSAFPSHRDVNPAHWDSKMIFWKQCIIRYCQHHHHICIDQDKLKMGLTRNGRQPLGLTVVIDDMIQQNQLIPVDQFQSSSMITQYIKKFSGWLQTYFVGQTQNKNNLIVLHIVKV